MPDAAMKNGGHMRRFDEMAVIVNDRIDDPSEADVDRYVGLEHLDSDSLTIRRWGSPDDVEATKLRFRTGDIIFGRRRAYQRKLAVADFDGICSAHAMVLRARPGVVLPAFLSFLMQSDVFMERATEISVGSLSPTINWRTLAKEQFALPTLEEQQRIADALSAASRLVETLRHQLTAAAKLVESQIIAFEQSLDRPISGRLKMAVARIESGKSPSGLGRPAKPGEFGVLKVSAVGDWRFVEEENKVVPQQDFAERFQVKPGDFLVTRANADPNSVGRTCLVEACRTALMISDKTWRLILKPEAGLDPIALLAWTKSPSFRKHVRNQLGGTDAKNISKLRFLSAPLPMQDVRAFNVFGKKVRVLRSAQLETARRLAASIGFSRMLAEKVFSR